MLNGLYVFSSPEHEVLMVSYYDRPVVSGCPSCDVCRASCVNIWCLYSRDHICEKLGPNFDETCLLYIKRWQKRTLKNLLSQVSVPGPSGPSCFTEGFVFEIGFQWKPVIVMLMSVGKGGQYQLLVSAK